MWRNYSSDVSRRMPRSKHAGPLPLWRSARDLAGAGEAGDETRCGSAFAAKIAGVDRSPTLGGFDSRAKWDRTPHQVEARLLLMLHF